MFSQLSGLEIVYVLVSILIALTIHEAMHGFMAHWLGDTTAQDEGRLTLNPLKHVDLATTILLPLFLILAHIPPFFAAKPVPFNPERLKYDEYGAALVGIAGPVTNFVLAAISAGILRFFAHYMSADLSDALLIFTEVNVSFFVFNMIPFPPLDGSRLLYAFAPRPLQELMLSIERLGFTAILLFMVFAIYVISPFIGTVSTAVLKFLLGV